MSKKRVERRRFLVILRRLKLHQGSRVSRKLSRSIFGDVCGKFVVIHHHSRTEKLEEVLMSLTDLIASPELYDCSPLMEN